ncbi:Nuclear factor 7 [Nibea albiflora]|uniref:Nuclear factor 7 n=1 Tax=Nibea albiflora TaxID=240163 RepID=A0ACB7FLN7_NIBAL|nr:Nuclear factor 7 [Nibea albiflora]
MASSLDTLTTGSPSMSCPPFLTASLAGAEAEGLASPPWSVDSPERCEEHGESLSMFCLDDLEPLCKQCAAVSHAGHRVYLLTEAATDCKAEAKLTEELMKKEFESLHQFLREEEAARLWAVREKREEKKREAEEQIDRMNQMIKSLEEKIQLIEEEFDAGGDGVQFLQHYQDTMSSTRTGSTEPQKVCRPLLDVAEHLGNLQYAVWEKMKHIAPYTPVTLDPRTAGQSLRVCPELNGVSIIPGPSPVAVPANPERFHPYSCILAREGFDSGVHCWDIEVGDTSNWTVGVAAESVSRRTEFEACPEAGLWCISLRDGKYRALTTPSQDLDLDNSNHLSRVRVRLDCDEGTLAFLNADDETHLFTFRCFFTEKVYPYFESISLGGGLAVLAQNVNISVGPDDDFVGDSAIAEEDQMMKSESCREGDIKTTLTNSNSEISECGRVTRDKNNQQNKLDQQTKRTTKEQLIQTKPTRKEKTKENRPAVKKQSSKPSFSLTYHISLNTAKHHQQ